MLNHSGEERRGTHSGADSYGRRAATGVSTDRQMQHAHRMHTRCSIPHPSCSPPGTCADSLPRLFDRVTNARVGRGRTGAVPAMGSGPPVDHPLTHISWGREIQPCRSALENPCQPFCPYGPDLGICTCVVRWGGQGQTHLTQHTTPLVLPPCTRADHLLTSY